MFPWKDVGRTPQYQSGEVEPNNTLIYTRMNQKLKGETKNYITIYIQEFKIARVDM